MYNFEHRCQCGKLLHKGVILSGVVSAKCRRCGRINSVFGLGTNYDTDGVGYIILHKMAPDFSIVDGNEAAAHALGYDREELRNLTVDDIDPKVKGGDFTELKKFLSKKSGNRVDFNSIHIHKDGHTYPVRIHSIIYHLRNGELYGIARVVPYQEVTDVGGSINDFFSVSLSEEGICLSVSDEVLSLLGYRPEDLLGTFFFDLYTPKWKSECFEQLGEAVKNKTAFHRTPELFHKDGSVVEMELFLKPANNYVPSRTVYEGICFKR